MQVEKEKKALLYQAEQFIIYQMWTFSYLNMLLENTAGAKERWGMLLEIEVETRL